MRLLDLFSILSALTCTSCLWTWHREEWPRWGFLPYTVLTVAPPAKHGPARTQGDADCTSTGLFGELANRAPRPYRTSTLAWTSTKAVPSC